MYLYAGAQSAALGPWPPDIEDTCATAPELHDNIQATENTSSNMEILRSAEQHQQYVQTVSVYIYAKLIV